MKLYKVKEALIGPYDEVDVTEKVVGPALALEQGQEFWIVTPKHPWSPDVGIPELDSYIIQVNGKHYAAPADSLEPHMEPLP